MNVGISCHHEFGGISRAHDRFVRPGEKSYDKSGAFLPIVLSMKTKNKTIEMARRVAASQGGLLTVPQADQLGISDEVRRRLIREGSWRRVVKGLFALTEDSWTQRAWAGAIIGGPQAVLGHETALRLNGAEPCSPWTGSRANCEPPITVFVGRRAGFPHDDRWRFIRSSRDGYGSPARTSLSEAIVDVGEYWRADDLMTLVGGAVTGRMVTAETLLAELDARGRHRQRGLFRGVVNDVSAGTTTVLERYYHTDVEAQHGLPIPLRQAYPAGRYRVDNWYDYYRLIVEVDGRATHVGLAASVDMDRDNFHMAHGISTLRFTWENVVHEPCRTARTIAEALARSGWTGEMHPCPRCPSNGRDYLR